MSVRVGTSGYNYPEWRGSFYPKDMKPASMLPYYAERFGTVEINNTFYRMPTPKTVASWAAQVPEPFVFVLKAPQRITHFSRLREVGEHVSFFCETALTLGPRLGPLLFQLPPNFKADAERLGSTLALLPSTVRTAWEFRNASWFTDETYALLRAKNAALAIVEDEDGSTPAVATADWGYFRLRAVEYTDAQLARWAATIREVGAGWRDAFVFFKHEEGATGPALAKRFEALTSSGAR